MTDSIILIIDCSKSCENYVEDYVKTVNSFLQNIHPNTLLTIILINQKIRYLCINSLGNRTISVSDINPNGSLCLYDNFSASIYNMLKFYGIIWQKPPTVILMSDSEDTSSKKININQMGLQIAIAKEMGWKFICLGLIEDSVNLGRYTGFNTSILYNTSKDCLEQLCNFLMNEILTNGLDQLKIN